MAESRQHDAQNALTQVGGTPLGYSPNGEMTADHRGQTITYDPWGRVRFVTPQTGPGVEYTHDALARRITRREGTGPVTHFHHSAQWQVLEERINGQTHTQYVHSPVYVDAFVLRDRDTDGTGTLDERVYFLQDANFNVTAITNAGGDVLQRFVYDPYGDKTTLNANWSVLVGTDIHGILQGHQGGRFDPATGMYHFRFRDYSPELGRWNRQDPLGYVDGGNLTEYVGSNSLGFVDPTGGRSRGTAEARETERLRRRVEAVLADEIARHRGKTYDSCMGLSTYLEKLQSTLASISLRATNAKNPSWGYIRNRMYMPRTGDIRANEVVHELTHAFDDLNDINIKGIRPKPVQPPFLVPAGCIGLRRI